MIKVKHIDHINMNVKNLQDSVQFYREFFGLEVKEEGQGMDKPYVILGRSGAVILCLYESPKGEHANARKDMVIKHFGLHIEDFDQAYEALKKRGVELLYGGVNSYENSRSLYVADPSGHEIELSEHFGGGL